MKVDRSILSNNDQQMGMIADPNKIEDSITHLANVIDSNDDSKTDKNGDHNGTWKGLTPGQAAEPINGGRLDVLEPKVEGKADKQQEATFNVPLIGGATASAGRGIRVFKDSLGLVHVSLDFDFPADQTTAWNVGQLPVGYRPAEKISQNITALNSAGTAGAFGEMDILVDGSIMIGAPKGGAWRYFHIKIPAYKPA